MSHTWKEKFEDKFEKEHPLMGVFILVLPVIFLFIVIWFIKPTVVHNREISWYPCEVSNGHILVKQGEYFDGWQCGKLKETP